MLSVLCSVATPCALASPELYRKWNDACLVGDTKQIDGYIRKFEECLASDPDDDLARAYLGSACALRSKAGFWGPTKLKFLNLGRKHLDDAVARAPEDARVRMVRAVGYYRVPKRFNVRATSIADFKILVPIAENGKAGLKINERQAILYYAHLAFLEEGEPDAASVKARCHRLDPGSKYGKLTK